jgi:outer membrane protein assembly factor BamB
VRRALVVLVAAIAVVAAVHIVRSPREQDPLRRGGGRQPTLPRSTSPVGWPTYGFDAARSHAPPYELAPPFRTVWKDVGDWSLLEFPPVVADGRLFVGTNHGLLLALDAATGRVLWQRKLGRCIASSPAIAGETLVLGVLAAPPQCDRDVPSYIAAFDVRTGRTLWRHGVGPVEASPLVVGGIAIVGSWDGRLRALDATTGTLRWSFRTGGPIKAGAALAGRNAIVGSYDDSLYAVDTHTGALRWSTAVGARFYATPTVAGGRVINATTDGVVHAFDARSGAELWSRGIGRFAYSAAAVAHGRAYVGSYDHRLYALDVRTGDILWTHRAPGPVSGAPTVLGSLVYFSSCGSCSTYESNRNARRTFAVDAVTGRLAWSFPDGEYSPVVSDGMRVYLTGYTTLYALAQR